MKYRDTSRFVMRLWGQLVDTLCSMRFERDESDKETHHFYKPDGSLFVSVKLSRKMWDGDSGDEIFVDIIVEVRSPEGVLIQESFVDTRRFEKEPQHPLYEIFDLVHRPSEVVTPKATALLELLGSLQSTAR